MKLNKGAPFTGADALGAQKARGVTRKLVGFKLLGRGIARQGYPVWYQGKQVDQVRSGTQSPSLSAAIGTTFLPADAAKTGTQFEIECRGEKIPAEVVGRPFWKNGLREEGAGEARPPPDGSQPAGDPGRNPDRLRCGRAGRTDGRLG